MKVRDRLVLAVVAAIAVIAAMWLVVVSPERNQVTTLSGQIAGERESLQTAQAQLASPASRLPAMSGTCTRSRPRCARSR